MTKRLALLFFCICGALSSCIQEEAPNSECDITQVSLSVPNPDSFFYSLTDSSKTVGISDSVIVFEVRKEADISSLAPDFTITEGATMSPESGSIHDFSDGNVSYVVRSQDGAWNRTYSVVFKRTDVKPVTDSLVSYTFGFENFALENATQKYYYWIEDGKDDYWATGNPGFRLSKSSAKPDEYPTVPSEDGVSGQCVNLTTRSTGGFGALVNMRLAAGNLFIGSFDVSQALVNTLQATCFGKPFTQSPVRIKGFYKYSPGSKYQDKKGNEVKDKIDEPDIYAVFYKNTDDEGRSVLLNGSNVLSSPALVAVAQLERYEVASQWTEFNIPFIYSSPSLDLDRLRNRGYSLAIVFSSSKNGADFCGAIGSELMIDEVTLICNKDED